MASNAELLVLIEGPSAAAVPIIVGYTLPLEIYCKILSQQLSMCLPFLPHSVLALGA